MSEQGENYTVNGRICHYENPALVFSKAKDEKRNYYCFMSQRILGFDLPVIVELAGDPNLVYSDNHFDNKRVDDECDKNDSLLARDFVGVQYLIDELIGDIPDEEFVVIMNKYLDMVKKTHETMYRNNPPISRDGKQVPFDTWYKECVIMINNPSRAIKHRQYNGLYVTEHSVMIAFFQFGSKEMFLDYCEYLRNRFGDEEYEEDFLPLQRLIEKVFSQVQAHVKGETKV